MISLSLTICIYTIKLRNMEDLEWSGGMFRELSPESQYIDCKGNLYNSKQELVGKVPFIPTIVEISAEPHGTWYHCTELTKEENKELAMSHTHCEGSYYRTYVNKDSPFSWIFYYLCKTVKLI